MSEAKNTRAVVRVKDIRQAVADYMRSEGCEGADHDEHEAAVAKLLGVPMWDDESGYNFNQYATRPIVLDS